MCELRITVGGVLTPLCEVFDTCGGWRVGSVVLRYHIRPSTYADQEEIAFAKDAIDSGSGEIHIIGLRITPDSNFRCEESETMTIVESVPRT